MKRLFMLIAACLMSVATLSFGQVQTQSISFDDGAGPGNAGTYSPNDHFSVNLYLTFNGYTALGYSLWFHITAAAAPYVSLPGRTYGSTFSTPNPFVTFPLSFSVARGNFYTTPDQSDLGGVHAGIPPGTYSIGDLSVDLNGLPAGTYVLATDDIGGHRSEVSQCQDRTCIDHFLPSAEYTITVIPEPSPFVLVAVSFLGAVGVAARRRTQQQ